MISLKTTRVPLLLLALLSLGACSGGNSGGDGSSDNSSDSAPPAVDQDSEQNAAANECVIGQSAIDSCTLK